MPEPLPLPAQPVVAAPTSNAAVIDWFPQGPIGQAVRITSLGQLDSVFGGLSEGSEGSYAVQQFFLNGGSLVWVVRVAPEDDSGPWAADGSDFTAALLAQLGGSPAIVPALTAEIFNILLVPGAALLPPDSSASVIRQAVLFCQQNQAFFLVDPPPPSAILQNPAQVQTQLYPWLGNETTQPAWVDSTPHEASIMAWAESYAVSQNNSAATYYPWLTLPDPVNNSNPRLVGPSGTVAGIYARTDASQNVWSAPAGTDAVLIGATLSVALTDSDTGILAPQGINPLRSLPNTGNVVWGARTLAGSDLQESQFKYVNVRRLTNFIEQSLVQSLQWTVFDPNAAPLWNAIQLEATSFLAGLFAQSAFQGTTPAQAYFVQCDSSTTSPQNILDGVVNVIVGFAPVYPAEFIVLQIQLMAGQSSA
jgi:hypothetical protein